MENQMRSFQDDRETRSLFEIFLDFCKTVGNYGEFDFIYLEDLKQTVQTTTPVTLPLSNPLLTYMKLRDGIIINFARNRLDRIQKFGLDSLHRILTKSVDNEDTKILFILMLHVTKMSLQDPAASFKNFEKISVAKMSLAIKRWRKKAKRVLKHTQITSIIKELMLATFGAQYAKRSETVTEKKIRVKFIKCDETKLRGFTGMDTVFINETHFSAKAFELHLLQMGTPDEKNNVMLIDVATTCLHDLAHLRIREVFDNLNFSTPNVMINSPSSHEREFGRITERKIFGEVINWKKSYARGGLSMNFVESFVQSLKGNTSLPPLPAGEDIVSRESQTTDIDSGVDMDLSVDSEVEIE